LPFAFREEEVDGTLLVPIAALEKGVGIKEGPRAVFCGATFEEFLPDSFGH
jgi:hypothetical protein